MKLNPVSGVSWFFSMLASAGIGAIYVSLFRDGYFPQVGQTVWVAVAVSMMLLGLGMLRTPLLSREELLPLRSRASACWRGTIVGAVATTGSGMMALAGFLTPTARSALVLVFLTAMFFVFEMIQFVAYMGSESSP